MKPKHSVLLVFFPVMVQQAMAQEKAPAKFGDVSQKDFASRVYSIDSNASAVVIADIGSASIEGNRKGWFSVVSRHYKRVHILNKNGFDMADVSLSVYGDEVKLDKLRAVTYNLENGRVAETKLDTKTGVFENRITKELVEKKFTLPNVKEGSIIEYEYTVISDYIRYLDPWEFQGAYPRLWSEYNLSVPSFFYYVFLTQGYLRFDINERREGSASFHVTVPNAAGRSDFHRVNAGSTDYRWVIKNVPALKEEAYTSTLGNHIQKIDFLLVEQKEPLNYHRYVESWPQITGVLLESEFFGQQLDKDNGWMDEILGPELKGIAGKKARARKIFAYIRDHFTCTSHSRRGMDQNLKNLVKVKRGNVAEINLLLTAMLRHDHIVADPVLLSTRSNGFTFSEYPILSQYNYVICRALIDGKTFFLDASEPHMGFGRLPLRCYNGDARVINKEAEAIILNPDSLVETRSTTVFIINDEKGNLVGSVQQNPGYYGSDDLRDLIREKGVEPLQKDIIKNFGAAISVSNFRVDSLDRYDEVLGIHYDFEIRDEKEDIIYLDPMFGEGYKENLFKSAERFYPVEMPYVLDKTYNLQMEVPAGYVVEELPQPVMVRLNDNGDIYFEYRISQSGNNVSLRSRVRFNRSYFMPDEYESLREFFSLVVKKQAEQIVFKKKK